MTKEEKQKHDGDNVNNGKSLLQTTTEAYELIDEEETKKRTLSQDSLPNKYTKYE
jgi:hypothetical protein